MKTIADAEKEHVGWMSTASEYNQIWGSVLSDIKKVQYNAAILVKATKKGKPAKGIEFLIFTALGFNVEATVAHKRFIAENNNVFVWPIGVLYRGGAAVHWNVFVYFKNGSHILRFDPAMSCASPSCYAYSATIPNTLAKVFEKPIHTYKLQLSCQKDPAGSDHFCQTWIILFVDYFLHHKKARSEKNFDTFDFFNKGKIVLKSWLRCVYHQLKYGPKETWYQYTMRTFPLLFHNEVKGKAIKSPENNQQECWKTIDKLLQL